MLKLRGLGLTGLLVFSGLAVTTLPAWAPTNYDLTLRNNSSPPPTIPVFQAPPKSNKPATPPKPAKTPAKPVQHP
jgi:hypothetical protein